MNMKQDAFMKEYIKSQNATEAYQNVYKCKRTTAKTNASKLLSNANFRQRYATKLAELEQTAVLTVQQRRQLLSDLSLNDNVKNSDKIKAIDTLNKIDNLYADNTNKQDTTINIMIPDSLKELSE